MAANGHPKVFISYSWTSEAYKERVLKLAERLMDNGVDVILDQWDLSPGEDMYAFMEQSIHEAEKVLILCEKGYAEKANSRTGGVGTETMIITQEVLKKHRQKKYIPVVMDSSVEVPSYLKSRFAVYYTTEEEEEFRGLCMAIFGKRRKKKPDLKPIPAWLEGEPSVQESMASNNGVSEVSRNSDEVEKAVKPVLGEIPEWIQDEEHPVTKTSASQRHLILHKGDKYKFGHYPKERDGKDEPLLWRVLDVDTEKGRALLITENLIDCRKYHEKLKDITWEECDLRKWMNGEFLDRAFDKEELGRVAEMPIMNPDSTQYATKDARATKDKVFVLSIDEAEKYFSDDVDRRAVVTPYAEKHGSFSSDSYTTADGQPVGWWWLRSPGSSSYSASIVFTNGGFNRFGSGVDFDGVSVRPALWLTL